MEGGVETDESREEEEDEEWSGDLPADDAPLGRAFVKEAWREVRPAMLKAEYNRKSDVVLKNTREVEQDKDDLQAGTWSWFPW